MAREGYYAVDGDSNDLTIEPTDERGAVHLHGVKDIGGLETVFFHGNHPAKMILRHVDVEGKIERGSLGGEKDIGIPIDNLGEFIELCCESDWPTTVDASVHDRVVEEFNR